MNINLLKTYYNPQPRVPSGTNLINLLTPNQADGTDTLGTVEGFEETQCTISSSLTQAHTGTRSLKVITNGANNPANTEGAYITQSCDLGGAYLFKAWIYATVGDEIRLGLSNGEPAGDSNGTKITGNGGWQVLSYTQTATGGLIYPYVYAVDKTVSKTFYIDDLILALTS